MDIEAYFQAFSSGEDDAVVDRWFTDDVVFEYQDQRVAGKQAWREFLRFAHDGVREIMRPVSVVRNDPQLFAEVDMDFHALKDRPEFPFGPLKVGDMYTVKFFVLYNLAGDQISCLRMATWPANIGTSSMPRLGGRHITQRAAFEALQRALDLGRGATQYCQQDRDPDALVGLMQRHLVQSAKLVSASDDELRLDADGAMVRLQLAEGLVAAVA